MVFLWRVIAESHFDSFHLEKDIYYPDICIALCREYSKAGPHNRTFVLYLKTIAFSCFERDYSQKLDTPGRPQDTYGIPFTNLWIGDTA